MVRGCEETQYERWPENKQAQEMRKHGVYPFLAGYPMVE
jgi:hypothetical protein